tara:strand:- start:536 stop:1201 length:666 start_codon:yes stop_codon:yes gene_type:complete
VKYALYLRISNAKSGGVTSHGVEAQRRDLDLYLKSNGGEVVGEFIDVMSGRKDDRPELQKALELCRRTGCVLLASKVDRVSRDVEFWARLCKDKRLKIKVAQLPNADTFQIHLFAALANQEAAFISARTKAALAAAKAKGVVLGNPKLSVINRKRSKSAGLFAEKYSPIINPLREKGYTYQEIAVTLNNMGLKTARGKNFYPMQVKRIIDRTNPTQVLGAA